MVTFEKLYDLVLTISEQFVEALSWETHRDDPWRDIAQIKVELAVLVAVTIAADQCAQNGALSRPFFHFFAIVDFSHKVGVSCLTEVVKVQEVNFVPSVADCKHHALWHHIVILLRDYL